MGDTTKTKTKLTFMDGSTIDDTAEITKAKEMDINLTREDIMELRLVI